MIKIYKRLVINNNETLHLSKCAVNEEEAYKFCCAHYKEHKYLLIQNSFPYTLFEFMMIWSNR